MHESKIEMRQEIERLTAAYDGPIHHERDTGRITVRCPTCHSRRTITTEDLLRVGVVCLRCCGRMRIR